MNYAELSITFGFQDDTTRKMTVGPYSSDAAVIRTFKDNVINLNESIKTAIPDPENPQINELILSDGGAAMNKEQAIIAAQLVNYTRTDYELG